MVSLHRNIATHIITLGGLGEKTKFPGTLASFASLVFSFLSYYFFNKTIYTILFLIFVALGLWAIHEIHKRTGQKDYSHIVIDEWIGMWLTNFFLFELNFTLIQAMSISVGAFIIFRIIDIFKFIPPIGIINKEKKQTAISVILDDVIAGCYSYAILMLVFRFYDIDYIYFSFLFLLPVMIANMTPVLLRGIKKLEKPINEKIFGQNKTWRGFTGGVFLGILSYFILVNKGFFDEIQNSILFAFLLSLGTLLGDLVKSYFKRRAGLKEGEGWIPWDQIDYIIGAIIMTFFIYNYSLKEVVLLLIIGGTMSALAHRYAYLMKMIDTKW